MRKLLIGLLAASVIASPALADKGGKGRGGGPHKAAKAERGGGKQFRGRDDRGGQRARVAGWQRQDHFRRAPAVRVARWDDDRGFKQQRKAWKQIRKDERRFWKEARRDWRPDRRVVRVREAVRYAPVPRYYDERVYAPVRYARPAVSYARPAYYTQPNYGYSDPYLGYAQPYYASSGFGYAPYGYDQGGLFGGGGGGILGALLPVILSSVIGGDLSGGLGGLGGPGGVGTLGGLGGLTNVAAYQNGYSEPYYDAYSGYPADYGYSDYGNFSDYGSYAAVNELTGSPYALPIDQVSYADPVAASLIPASSSGGDLSSLLLPALLNEGGSIF